MILREYQEKLVAKAQKALKANGNTLVVAPTGSGKTVMFSALVGAVDPEKVLVLQHRDELLAQNMATFRRINPGFGISTVDAGGKDFSGRAVFAMVQTLYRHIESIPSVDMVVVDEAHHATAPTYKEILEWTVGADIVGFTATPARGDGKGLRSVFSNVAGSIGMPELVRLNHLVPPRCLVSELKGVPEALKSVRKTASGEYDLDDCADIMDRDVHNQRVVQEWMRYARDRKTIVFAATVKHCRNVMEEFLRAGIRAAMVTGETPSGERERLLSGFDDGTGAQVLCNVAVLTEGYDSPKVGCVVLLRPCSYRSTMIQMIGRGLRIADGKSDCIVIDFGTSLLTHGDLNCAPQLDDRPRHCPNCSAEIPQGLAECPICGYAWTGGGGGKREDEHGTGGTDIELVEIDLFKRSPFKWCDVFGAGKVMVASGFTAKVFVVSRDGETFHAFGLRDGQFLTRLTTNKRHLALSVADDFMREYENSDSAKKSRRWMKDPVSEKQMDALAKIGYPKTSALSFTKYSAACLQSFHYNLRAIERGMR